MRAHIVVPDDLIEAVDELAGPRNRSRFIEEAIRDKVFRERQGIALKKYAGILKDEDYPEWSTPEKISQWVHDQRRLDRRPITGSQDE